MGNLRDTVTKLRALRKVPLPVRVWAQSPEVGCSWKDDLPRYSVCVETLGGISALGEAVAAFPRPEQAEEYVAIKEALPALLDAASRWATLCELAEGGDDIARSGIWAVEHEERTRGARR
jgi:hypothetical protein